MIDGNGKARVLVPTGYVACRSLCDSELPLSFVRPRNAVGEPLHRPRTQIVDPEVEAPFKLLEEEFAQGRLAGGGRARYPEDRRRLAHRIGGYT